MFREAVRHLKREGLALCAAGQDVLQLIIRISAAFVATIFLTKLWPTLSGYYLRLRSAPLSSEPLLTCARRLAGTLGIAHVELRQSSVPTSDVVALPGGVLILSHEFAARFADGRYATEDAEYAIAHAFGCIANHHAGYLIRPFGLSAQRAAERSLGAFHADGCTPRLIKRASSALSRTSAQRILAADGFAVQLLARTRHDPFCAITFLSKKKAWRTPPAQARDPMTRALGFLTLDDRIAWIEAVIADELRIQRRRV